MPDTSEFSLTALRALRLIGQSGSMSLAAQALNITQSGVSRAVANLERQSGLILVAREARPLSLTRDGEALVARAERVERELDGLLQEAERRRKGSSGVVVIGSFGASASTRVLPRLVKGFHRHMPKIAVEIREYKDAEILPALDAGAIDLAVLANPAIETDQITIAEDQLVALVPDDHAFTKRGQVQPDDFRDEAFILSKAGSGHLISKWFGDARQDVRPAHTIEQLSSIIAMVRAGLGISIVAELALPETHPGVVAVPLHPVLPRIVSLIRKPGHSRSAAAERFWQFAESFFDQ